MRSLHTSFFNDPNHPLLIAGRPLRHRPVTVSTAYSRRNLTVRSSAGEHEPSSSHNLLPTIAASAALLFLSLGGISSSACFAATSGRIPPPVLVAGDETLVNNQSIEDDHVVEEYEDEEVRAAFESYKSKTYALTVPLRVIALRNSVPPLWIKNFIQSQGRRVKFRLEFRGTLEGIFSELSETISKGNVTRKSAGAADIISLGDSWVNFAISESLIEPIQGVEDQDWFCNLGDKWKHVVGAPCLVDIMHMVAKRLIILRPMEFASDVRRDVLKIPIQVIIVQEKHRLLGQMLDPRFWLNTYQNPVVFCEVYLRRNSEGKLDTEGRIWAAPYRWGSMVIAYKKSKFQKHNLAPIEDWADLWRHDLAGKISMVDSPREVIGAVLKCLGASYNTSNIDSEVAGGRDAVQHKLDALRRQVCLFDSASYLKAFSIGDVWVAVGWSSDILPAAKRMSDVAVIVPKSGASLWADLWTIPAASGIATDGLGGRARGPSPLVHQWIDFCLQPQRALPFEEEVVPGASPSALENTQVQKPKNLLQNKPKLDTNLIAGVPPPDILTRCEFLEPLSDSVLLDYQHLIASMQNPKRGILHEFRHYLAWLSQALQPKLV